MPETETEAVERVALGPSACRSVVSAYADLPERNEPRGWQRELLVEQYGALMRHEGAHRINDLRQYFKSFGTSEPKQGLYADPDRWWKETGRSQLLTLPGVEPTSDGKGVEYTGTETDEVEDVRGVTSDDVRDLDAHRAAPRTRIRRALDERHDPYGERYAHLLVLADALAEADGDVEPEDIDGDYTLPSLDDGLGDDLADLPCIERERVNVSAEDISLDDLDTLADLEAAKERVASGAETVYRFEPGSDSEV